MNELFEKLDKKGMPEDKRAQRLEDIKDRSKFYKSLENRDSVKFTIGNKYMRKLYEYWLTIKNETFREGGHDKYFNEEKVVKN